MPLSDKIKYALLKRKYENPVGYARYLEQTLVIDFREGNGLRLEHMLGTIAYRPCLIIDGGDFRYSISQNDDLWDYEIMSRRELEAFTTVDQLHDKLINQISVYQKTNDDNIFQDMFQTVLEIFEITKQ